jgi:putative ABC transport system permease protein
MIPSSKSFLRTLANRLLERKVGPLYREEFLGDLDELYDERLVARGKVAAETMYWVDTLHLLIGFYHSSSQHRNQHTLFTGNMVKIAWRTALRHKQFTLLNLLGLTLGIATCLTIGLYVYDESTYDTFHPNGDRIYRVNQSMIWGDWNTQMPAIGPGVAEALKEDAPEFEQITRLLAIGEKTVRVTTDGKPAYFTEPRYFAAEENFFKIFPYRFLKGNPATALKESNSMVITASTARRYFGTEDAIGKLIDLKQTTGEFVPYAITGVLADPPVKSHLRFDLLGSMATIAEMKDNSWKWIWTAFATYGLVRQGTNIPALTEKIQALPPKWAERTTQQIFNQNFKDYTAGKKWSLYLQPVRSIYLDRDPGYHRFGPHGSPDFIVIFGAVGILVLALSCINFMNLSTARSGNRAKEVGVRKVLGSQKIVLIRQFIVESILYVTVAAAAAFVLVQLSLGTFNTTADRQLSLWQHLTNPVFIGMTVAFVLFLGIVAGSYPAFYLSAFQPAETLKGKGRTVFKGAGIRNGLVIFQFTVSIALIICTFFVQKQLSFSSHIDRGIVKSQVLQIHNIDQLKENGDVLKTKLSENPMFEKVARSNSTPPYVWDGDRYRAEGPDKPVVDLKYMRVDEDYLPLLGVVFLAGRNFDPANPDDKHKIILNEEAVRILGWGSKENWGKDSPIGKFVIQSFGNDAKLEVVGVVKNFNFNSVRQAIDPLLIMHEKNDLHWSMGQGPSFLSLRLHPKAVSTGDDLQAIVGDVKQQVAALDPSLIFQYSFMNDEFEATFRAEHRMGVILNFFTVLAVVIACLGLFGLAAFSAEQRLKELGIRKVMGAKVSELVILFSKEFTKLVIVSVLLASPIAWFLTNYWLANFAYRTPIDAWVFAVAALSALSIAGLTVSYQAFSAARTNPVDTLRNE